MFLFSTMCLHAAPSRKFKSFLKSMIIPGWGEISNGDKTGYVHMAAEVLLFSTKYYYEKESDIYETNAEDVALKYSGIGTMNITNQHKDDLGRYDSSGYGPNGYNANILQTMVYSYPDFTDQQKIDYLAENTYSEEMGWDWDTSEHQKKYRVYRKKSLDFKDNAKVVTSAILLNHLASGIHAMISATRLSDHAKNVNVGFTTDRENNLILNASLRF